MEFSEYDEGFRLGTFDKCNGRDAPRVEEDGSIFATGYYDAWASNEAQINEPTEEAQADAAYNAGKRYALEDAETRRHAAAVFGDFEDNWWDGFDENR